MPDPDFRNDHTEELNRKEHRRKNVAAKAVIPHGYDSATDSYLPVGVVTNPDGSYSLPTGSANLKVKIDKGTTNIVYIGQAARGSATSSAVWTITKIDKTVTDNVTVTHTGTTATWDDRADVGTVYS